jgi:uncharacterized protein (TIGR02271 family)
MTRSEERLHVGTEQVQAGRARLRKYVVTENVTQTVPVSHEEVRLEREPVTDANRGAATSGSDISEEEHEVTLRAERPVVSKDTVVGASGSAGPSPRPRVSQTSAKERIDDPGVKLPTHPLIRVILWRGLRGTARARAQRGHARTEQQNRWTADTDEYRQGPDPVAAAPAGATTTRPATPAASCPAKWHRQRPTPGCSPVRHRSQQRHPSSAAQETPLTDVNRRRRLLQSRRYGRHINLPATLRRSARRRIHYHPARANAVQVHGEEIRRQGRPTALKKFENVAITGSPARSETDKDPSAGQPGRESAILA